MAQELTAFESFVGPDRHRHRALARSGASGWLVGFTLFCRPRDRHPAMVTVHVRTVPDDGGSVRLTVRTDDGREAHFGQAVRGDPVSGL